MRLATGLLFVMFIAIGCESAPATDDKAPAEAAPATATTPESGEKDAPAATASSLDGKSFMVKSTDSSGEVTEDTLVFADGTFDSLGCHEYGFSKAAYQASDAGGAIEFTSVATSEKEGKMTWKGKVEGDKISGSYEWVKEGQNPMTVAFEGTVK